jgi:hypothetical protein
MRAVRLATNPLIRPNMDATIAGESGIAAAELFEN